MNASPTLLILNLVRRALAAGCTFGLTLGLIDGAARREIAERNAAAAEAEAIDAQVRAIRAKLEQALANDPPKLRREILAMVEGFHARQTAHAAALRVQLPLPLAGA